MKLMNVMNLINRMDDKILQMLEKNKCKHSKRNRSKCKLENCTTMTNTDWFMIAVAKFSPIAMLSWIAGIGIFGLFGGRLLLFYAVPICVAAGFLSRFISGWISRLVPRKRPFQHLTLRPLIEHHPDASFPSNHAAGGFALASALFQLSHMAGIIFLIWAIVLAYSRLYVRLHFFSDVFAGAIIGTASGIVSGIIGQYILSMV